MGTINYKIDGKEFMRETEAVCYNGKDGYFHKFYECVDNAYIFVGKIFSTYKQKKKAHEDFELSR